MRKYLLIGLFLFSPLIALAGLETATYINGLVSSNPTGNDNFSTTDDHIRLLKTTVKNSFPNISGPMLADQTELNILDGTTITTSQLNAVAALSLGEIGVLDGLTSSTTELNLLTGRTGTIWTSTNDGAASTLDADLLDGLGSGSFFRLSPAATQSVPGLVGITDTSTDFVREFLSGLKGLKVSGYIAPIVIACRNGAAGSSINCLDSVMEPAPTKLGTGIYEYVFDAGTGDGPSSGSCTCTQLAAVGFCAVSNQTANSIRILTYNTSGVATDRDHHFICAV